MDQDGRQKRRLPLWMLGTTVVDRGRNSEEKDESIQRTSKRKLASDACLPKPEARNKISGESDLLHDEGSLDNNSCVTEKLCRMKRKKKVSELDADCEIDTVEVGSKRNKVKVPRTVQWSVTRKSKNKESINSTSEAVANKSLNDDDEELTMEDLMSIAEEYVKADEEMQPQQLSDTVCISESRLSGTGVSRTETGGNPTASQRSTLHEIAPSHSMPESLAEETVIGHNRTGDASQDMMNLYLGPLLKKPLEEDKKIGFLTENMKFSCDLKKQSESNIIGEGLVPFMKKKSSLKDKVALFLD